MAKLSIEEQDPNLKAPRVHGVALECGGAPPLLRSLPKSKIVVRRRSRQSINFRKVAPIFGTYLKAHYFLFSAKAACSFKPGATPQVTTSFQKQALKARINRDYREVNRAFSADDFLFL
jgi:hypothetical protein